MKVNRSQGSLAISVLAAAFLVAPGWASADGGAQDNPGQGKAYGVVGKVAQIPASMPSGVAGVLVCPVGVVDASLCTVRALPASSQTDARAVPGIGNRRH